jgi:glycosyltransferase involved in cell wall biosynthesis
MGRNFDVIIPAHDAAATIARALRSVSAQTLQPSRMIVVADACRDDTAALARIHGAEVLEVDVRSPGSARNAALASANATWVAFLDADDAWQPRWLATVHATAEKAGDALDVVAGRVLLVDSGPTADAEPAIRRLGARPRSTDLRTALLTSAFMTTSAVAVRREAVVRVGGFPPWRVSEDFDLWLRLADDDARWCFLDEPLVDYHLTPHSAMRTPGHRKAIAAQHRTAVENSLFRRPLSPRAADAARAVVAAAAAERAVDNGARAEALAHVLASLRLRPALRPALLAAATSLPPALLRFALRWRRRRQQLRGRESVLHTP